MKITWIWSQLLSWVSVHFARHHIGWEKFISTQRTDRTNVNRNELPQGTLVDMKVESNAQALINVSRVRLCYQASPETRQAMVELKKTIYDIDKDISNVMVPNCVYRHGCPEFEMCKEKFWSKFVKYCKENDWNYSSIQSRYDAYNEMFWEGN